MFRRSSKFMLVSVASLTLVAAGGLALAVGARSEGGGPGGEVRLAAAADGSLRFERRSVTVPAGRLSIEMPNPSVIPHAVAVRGNGVEATGETVGRGQVSRVTVDLPPGDYTLVCPVGGHEEAGMTAKLRVVGGSG